MCVSISWSEGDFSEKQRADPARRQTKCPAGTAWLWRFFKTCVSASWKPMCRWESVPWSTRVPPAYPAWVRRPVGTGSEPDVWRQGVRPTWSEGTASTGCL